MGDEPIAIIELDYSLIPDRTMRRLDEVTVKRDGQIWRIHKNDADPFPSNPHAHNVESGLKLDLRNGDLYFRGQVRNRVNRKHLLHIRELVTAKGVELPALSA